MQEPLPPPKNPPPAAHELWQRCLHALARQVPPNQVDIWLRPLPAHFSPEDCKLTLRAPNQMKQNWVRQQYGEKITLALAELLGQPVTLEVLLAPAKAAVPKPQKAAPQTADATPPSDELPPATDDDAPTPAAPAQASNRLNAAWTFETLVEGAANRMAHAAGQHVAANPGLNYNPMFIYGGVGLGKTHLMHAIGNRLLQSRPNAKVLYTHADQFVSDVVKAARHNAFDEFKARYHSLDLLLIDDVQFLAGKERTQEEFFNTFESLLAKKSHIVMTSDTYPKTMANISERLVSRFDAGLTVKLEPPELEMRVAILMLKAQAEGAHMPEDVAFFIGRCVHASVRELEGALRKVLAYSRFSQREISIALAKEALHDLLSVKNRQVTLENIQKTVADFYKLKITDLCGAKRTANIARPRQIAMYLAKEMTQKSLPEIGAAFCRDHTTVLHAVRKITDERKGNGELNDQLHVLEQTIKG